MDAENMPRADEDPKNVDLDEEHSLAVTPVPPDTANSEKKRSSSTRSQKAPRNKEQEATQELLPAPPSPGRPRPRNSGHHDGDSGRASLPNFTRNPYEAEQIARAYTPLPFYTRETQSGGGPTSSIAVGPYSGVVSPGQPPFFYQHDYDYGDMQPRWYPPQQDYPRAFRGTTHPATLEHKLPASDSRVAAPPHDAPWYPWQEPTGYDDEISQEKKFPYSERAPSPLARVLHKPKRLPHPMKEDGGTPTRSNCKQGRSSSHDHHHSLPSSHYHNHYDERNYASYYSEPYQYVPPWEARESSRTNRTAEIASSGNWQPYYRNDNGARVQTPPASRASSERATLGYQRNFRPEDLKHEESSNSSSEFIWTLRQNDILCGRGVQNTNDHPGNRAFREMVREKQVEYLACKRAEKPFIAIKIMEMVQANHGRFLRRVRVPDHGYRGRFAWTEIGEQRVYEKVCQALRDGAPKIREHMMKMKESEEQQQKENSADNQSLPRVDSNGPRRSRHQSIVSSDRL